VTSPLPVQAFGDVFSAEALAGVVDADVVGWYG
jgi:hypothetical protein